MITIVLTYRNRDLNIVEKCLNSLSNQSFKEFKVFLVDYGSPDKSSSALRNLVNKHHFVELIQCPVAGQLWNKSRAINIALKQCNTSHFLVSDIDMIYHTEFVETLNVLKLKYDVIYFQVGFLNKFESKLNKPYDDYKINFKSNKEATGITFYNTNLLKSINGYNEFYHGWGSEDTDVHLRLKNANKEVVYHDKKILLLHQWHPKAYRSKNSSGPFHSNLERINHNYMYSTINNKVIVVNGNDDWGVIPNKKHYLKLTEKPNLEINIQPVDFHFSALLASFKNLNNQVVKVQINQVSAKNKLVQTAKKLFKKKHFNYLKLETINNLLLEEIIKNYRNKPYSYYFNREKGVINLTIYFS
tara:strand:+ start:3127 stop:4200 length:1074 start_codon:yes stop_codon:yes gene_type:complete